jgi:hypothetical protein
VTLGAAAVALPPEEALALAGEPDPAAEAAVEATEAIADETEAEASCRGRSGDATTPPMARNGRS